MKPSVIMTAIASCVLCILCCLCNMQRTTINTLQNKITQRDSVIKQQRKKIDNQTKADYNVTAKVRVTYYNLRGKTASGIITRQGICAVSRDLERKGFHLGEYVKVDGYGTFLIADRTSSRTKNTIDIWMPKGRRIKNGKKIKATLIYSND